MAVPATNGQLRTQISDMEIGDYISCKFQWQEFGFYQVGANVGSEEMPLGGLQYASMSRYHGFFYLVKCDRGLLIADRVIIHTVTWNKLNDLKVIEGSPVQNYLGSWNDSQLRSLDGYVRSLTGGSAFANARGGMSLTDTSNGAYPLDNEWEKYIMNFPVDLVQAGKTLDDVFHWGSGSWVRDTPVLGSYMTTNINDASRRVYRGRYNVRSSSTSPATLTADIIGFRPVFEYRE